MNDPRQRRLQLLATGAVALALTLLLVMGYTVYFAMPAQRQLTILGATSSEADALAAFQALAGLRGYRDEGVAAFKAFWERRARMIEASARRRIAEGAVDRGLVLGALAALKRHGDVQPEILEEYRSRDYSKLVLTTPDTVEVSSGDLAVSRDGSRMAIHDREYDVTVVEVATGKVISSFGDNSGWGVAFSRDGSLVATGDFENEVHIWQAATGDEVRALVGHTGNVDSVAFSPDGKLLATGSTDRTARLWDTTSWRLVMRLTTGEDVNCVAFSPESRQVATGDDDGMIRVWDTASGRELVTLYGHDGFVMSVAFSPDGSRLVSGGWEKPATARIWDLASGEAIVDMVGHLDNIHSVAFSPDGDWVATGSEDGTARVWDAWSGAELLRLTGHTDVVEAAEFLPDGERLATASTDGTARIWDLGPLRDPTAEPLPESPAERWQSWQRKLNFTVNDADEVIPLWPTGPRAPAGWDPSLEEPG